MRIYNDKNIGVNIDYRDFIEVYIKSCINNVTLKKRQTLLYQRLSLFVMFPILHLGTLFKIPHTLDYLF